jgi:hypothetical protein
VRHRVGFSGDDPELALVYLITERRRPTHPHALPLGGGDLLADALAGHLALELANDKRTFKVNRPIEVVVLNCWVT